MEDHVVELNKKNVKESSREVSAFGAKHQVGKEEIRRVKLKSYKTCLLPALLYRLEAWRKISKNKMNKIEKNKGKALKRIFSLPISTSYISLIMKTGAWPDNVRMQYRTMMLYDDIRNSDHKSVAKNILAEQTKHNHRNTMISKVEQMTQEIRIKIKNVESMSKSKWRKQAKQKIGKLIKKTKLEIENEKKARKMTEDKWERKKYFLELIATQ